MSHISKINFHYFPVMLLEMVLANLIDVLFIMLAMSDS